MTEIVVVELIDQLIDFTLRQVAPTSARVYQQTFKLWRAWCAEQDVNPLALYPVNVLPFLTAQDVVKATRQRQLSALRQLAKMLNVLHPSDGADQLVKSLGQIKAPTGEHNGNERSKRALAPSQADKVLRVWIEPTNTHRRNQALIAVLALGALRRSEAAALEWRDVDFENGVISVRHGKGDKAREVPLAGEMALDALRAWQMCQPAGRTYVFCRMTPRADKLGADKPIDGMAVWRTVNKTEILSGVEFKPHDLRRTFITEALDSGLPINEVQFIAGHARGETTLRYAKVTDARSLRKKLKLKYG